MANRTTVAAVKAILDDTELSDAVVESYIGSANTLITESLSTSTLSSAILTEIEKWLTAHMITVTRERLASQEEAGGAKIQYIGKFGEGLNSSPYGQQVMALDITGKLASLGRRSARMVAVEFEEW